MNLRSDDPIDVSVLIPVLNEVDGLRRCYESVTRTLQDAGLSYEIVFVDDGSSDGSTEILRALAAEDERAVAVILHRNVGQQRAMFAGLGYCRGAAVITYDADLQFAPKCLPELARKVLSGVDIVSGVRVTRRDPLLTNRIPSMAGRFLINRALRISQTDFGAVKAYSASLVSKMLRTTSSHIVIPALAYSLTSRVAEIPVEHTARITGRTKWSVLSRMELYLDVYTLYARRPFAWMMILGVLSSVIGVALAIGLVIYRLLVSQEFSGLIIFFDIFLLATGVYFFSISLVGEFVVRVFRAGSGGAEPMVREIVRGPGTGKPDAPDPETEQSPTT